MKRICLVLLALCLIFLCACGQNNNSIQDNEPSVTRDLNEDAELEITETTEPEQTTVPLSDDMIYSAFLSALCEDLREIIVDDTHLDGFDTREGMMGIYEMALAHKIDMLNKMGYKILDINDDGVSELLICEIDELSKDACNGTRILCAYTVSEGQLTLLYEGTSRNRYYLLDGTAILNEGSDGADSVCFGEFQLEKGSSALSCVDFYFTEPDDTQQIKFFHNQSGQWDTSASEAFTAGQDAFFELRSKCFARIYPIDLTPLDAFEN